MNEFRITLISDPTDEFPNNKNNNFKVRLPAILNLPGDTWQVSLWSVSVADEGHSPTVLSSNQDIGLIKYCYTVTHIIKQRIIHGWWTLKPESKR